MGGGGRPAGPPGGGRQGKALPVSGEWNFRFGLRAAGVWLLVPLLPSPAASPDTRFPGEDGARRLGGRASRTHVAEGDNFQRGALASPASEPPGVINRVDPQARSQTWGIRPPGLHLGACLGVSPGPQVLGGSLTWGATNIGTLESRQLKLSPASVS